jgi:hypothetical protein
MRQEDIHPSERLTFKSSGMKMSREHSRHLATASLMVVAQEKAQIWQQAEDVASQG